MLKHHVDTLLPETEVQARIKALAAEISAHYADSDGLVLVGLLRGSFIFLADLSRALDVGHEVDFMIASSYGNDMHSSREVRIHKDIEGELHHKDVLIVEDIIDTGYTLDKVREIIGLRSPRSLRICTLLDKPSRRETQVPVDWVGFAIPDEFVVGMGIDYAQQYRHLPYIGKVVLEE